MLRPPFKPFAPPPEGSAPQFENHCFRLNRQGREADHSPPTSAEVKNTRIYTSVPPYVVMP
jgi:hypothetical protein